MDVYIEPVLPRTQLVVQGRSPVGQALIGLAKAMGYQVAVAAPGARGEEFPDADEVYATLDLDRLEQAPRRGVVICTQGEEDETALRRALDCEALYIALVASRKKARSLLEGLSKAGFESDRLERIKAPAGLDIGAASAGEIAVSILAEFIQRLHARQPAPSLEPSLDAEELHRDPVCGMTVDPSTAEHSWEKDGKNFYFCCAACREAFKQGR